MQKSFLECLLSLRISSLEQPKIISLFLQSFDFKEVSELTKQFFFNVIGVSFIFLIIIKLSECVSVFFFF